MKLHLKRTPIFKLSAARTLSILAVAALTVSALLLSSVPVRAASQSSGVLDCQVSANGSGETIGCTSTASGVAVTLTCRSPNLIEDNGGEYIVGQATCGGSGSVVAGSLSGTITATALTINANTGTITVTSGTGTLTYNLGPASETVTCSGSVFSETLSPNIGFLNGTCSVNVDVFGIGTAQITEQGGSISATASPNLILSINGPEIIVSASVLAHTTTITCGSSIAVNLNQLPPITGQLILCSGS